MQVKIIIFCFLGFTYGIPAAIKPKRRELSSNRIIGGADTDIEKAPFVMAVEETISGDKYFLCCGAALISPTFAVTSAYSIGPIGFEHRVRVGTSKSNDGGLVIPVKRIIEHPKFTPVPHGLDYDVALIELEYPVTLNEQIQTIEIAENEPNTGDLVTYFGWGENDPNGTAIGTADTLQSVQVPIWDRLSCNDTYNENNVWFAGPIADRVHCAGATATGGCLWDLGDPFVIDNKLVGVMSWGYGCMILDIPQVFTNLLNSEIREFIRENAGV